MTALASTKLDLDLEVLEDVSAPLTDTEWGIAAGIAFMAGLALGAALAT